MSTEKHIDSWEEIDYKTFTIVKVQIIEVKAKDRDDAIDRVYDEMGRTIDTEMYTLDEYYSVYERIK